MFVKGTIGISQAFTFFESSPSPTMVMTSIRVHFAPLLEDNIELLSHMNISKCITANAE